MSTFPVLEFKISRQQEGVYSIALSYDLPGSAAEIRMGQSQPAIMHLNLAELSFQVQDSQIYAQTLSTSFFSDINVRLFFEKALVNANTLSLPLRVRLLIDASAPELHSVRWELLSNPKDGSALFLGENLYFSRYLESADWRAVRLHERRQLRALVVVSNPDNLDRYPGMAPVDVGGEVDRARQGLGDITPSVLGQNEPASLENLATRLRAEKPDILYISAHGALIQNEPYLWLQDPSGQAAVTSGQDLADRLQELTAPPLLVLLASCQSAGQESAADARSALGPRLAEVGVPAVIAMQGDITQTTLAEFMPTFYAALQEDGQVDYAVALARGHVRQRLDFWMPVLYLRLRDGRLWVEAEERPPTAEDRIATAIGDYHQDFLPRAKRQSEGFMRANQGTAGHPGVFIPAIYVHRRQVESQLESFLYSQEPAAILTGAPGVGKTSLLCHWAQGLLEAEQSVFIYNCATFLNSEVENYLLEDLSLTNREDLFPALNHIAGNARASEKQFVIIFDNLNDYRGSFDQKTGPYELLRKIDALVRNPNFPASAVRFLISCSTPTWSYLEKQDARFLEWAYRPPYYQPEEDQVINLAVFSDEELKAAYEAYKNYFELQSPFDALPEAIRQRMRTPDLLRMLAETYQSRPEPIAYEAQALSIFRRYYEQRVRRLQDKVLLKKLVVEMYNQKRVSLPLIDLASLDHFREELLSDDWNTSYKRLLEVGVLTETKSPFTGDTVSFTHSRFGAFALALHLGNQGPITETVLLGLVDESSDFPMVWDAAITMLLMGKDTSLFLDAAKSRNVALRELVVQALVELHADEPDNSLEMIQSLIDSSSMEAQRSGLKAAYWIGPGAREIYLWAASKGSDELRSAAKEILYLIWRQDPDFTYSLLDELANRLGPRALTRFVNIMEFLIDLSITIYINHPEQEAVVHQTTELWYKVLIERLHLNWVRTDLLGERVEDLLFRIVGRAFSGQLLKTALFTEFVPADRFFNLPEPERERFKQAVSLVDPGIDIQGHELDLQALLDSDLILFNILASMVLAIHAFTDFPTNRPLIEDLWEGLSPQGKAWLIMSFAVLLPDTPAGWSDILENFTRELVQEHPGILYGEEMPLIQDFDILLLPLGLSYAKQGNEMPYYQKLLRDAYRSGDRRLAQRCLNGLGLVGFYYPRAVLQTLRESLPDFKDQDIQEDLVKPLATMRTLYLDEVDNFVNQVGAGQAFQRRVSAATDIELIDTYIYSLGIYNNAVHQAINYPIMRRELLIGGLTALIEAHSPQDFVGSYTPVPLRMLRAANYRLDQWTLPE